MAVGAVLSLIGLALNRAEFGYAWLTAFMFYLSIVLGALFLVMIHHLTDAGWSVGIRRFCEHLGALAVSVVGDSVCTRGGAGTENLSLDDAQPAG